MQVRHLKIENFRGIRDLTWSPTGRFVCLIGHGDSTKTTILDALELALAGRWNTVVTDSDFYQLDISRPIRIEVTVGEVPQRLLDEDKFGLVLRGWNANAGELHDEPEDEDEEVITVRFEVSESLEPSWRVINDRNAEGRSLSTQDRDSFGVVRVSDDLNRHLCWGRSSALTKATEQGAGTRQILVEAQRTARQAVETATGLDHFHTAAGKAQEAATRMGAIVRDAYKPSLYTGAGASAYGTLSLHDGLVPLHAAGLGTRRLVTLGLQGNDISGEGILLIDEVEHGLEPHRLRHLLKTIRPSATGRSQVMLTTHSAVTLIELQSSDLQLVRSQGGETKVLTVSSELQDVLRMAPEAFLGNRVLVAEGRTELGLTRGLENYWAAEHGGTPLTHHGSVVVDGGGGSKAKRTSEKLRTLGFPTAIIVDSDDPNLDVGQNWQTQHGVSVLIWAGGMATEERAAADLSWPAFCQMVALAIEREGEASILDRVAHDLGIPSLPSASPEEWRQTGQEEAALRRAFGRAAKAKGWYKDVEWGSRLGEIVGSDMSGITTEELARTINEAGNWLYAG
jgi:putative ATP-dependent endonuclease of OLD family